MRKFFHLVQMVSAQACDTCMYLGVKLLLQGCQRPHRVKTTLTIAGRQNSRKSSKYHVGRMLPCLPVFPADWAHL
jgi:hypothetical protein